MSPSSDPTPPADDRRFAASDDLHRRAWDELPHLALHNPVDAELAAHIETCDLCQDELRAFRAIREIARVGAADDGTPGPSPQVWERIHAAVADDDRPGRTVTPTVTPLRPRRRLLAPLLAAAAVVAAAGIGWAVGHSRSAPASSTASADLAAQPGTAAAAHGEATMHASPYGRQMTVTTSGLPAPHGYYEVWLYDPSANKMVAIGTLGAKARGSFTVPEGIDTQAYHIVDVSDQRYNGDPSHQTSVLRGQITQ
ncbi:MAG: anti-sigma factor [Jatrophihabitans sp.]|uniref:anti-sigma factor n=1 Tax=Jatrophihabitans sp. TaxID=1932789 RepID=UPI003F7DCCFE